MIEFTFEETNLISIYSVSDRDEALQGLVEALSYVTNRDMIELIHQTIAKLEKVSSEDFRKLKIRAMIP